MTRGALVIAKARPRVNSPVQYGHVFHDYKRYNTTFNCEEGADWEAEGLLWVSSLHARIICLRGLESQWGAYPWK